VIETEVSQLSVLAKILALEFDRAEPVVLHFGELSHDLSPIVFVQSADHIRLV
jgi:hypothetical protein